MSRMPGDHQDTKAPSNDEPSPPTLFESGEKPIHSKLRAWE
jgi:hypothetical protein